MTIFLEQYWHWLLSFVIVIGIWIFCFKYIKVFYTENWYQFWGLVHLPVIVTTMLSFFMVRELFLGENINKELHVIVLFIPFGLGFLFFCWHELWRQNNKGTLQEFIFGMLEKKDLGECRKRILYVLKLNIVMFAVYAILYFFFSFKYHKDVPPTHPLMAAMFSWLLFTEVTTGLMGYLMLARKQETEESNG